MSTWPLVWRFDRTALGKENSMGLAWLTEWEERERGWGSEEADFTLHRDQAECLRYVAAYWDGMPDEAPDAFVCPCDAGAPVEVSEAVELWIQTRGSVLISRDAIFLDGGSDGTPKRLALLQAKAPALCSQIEEAWIAAGFPAPIRRGPTSL